MDLSKLSNEELIALKAGDYSKLSNEALQALKQKSSAPSFMDKATQSAKNIGKASIETLPIAGSLAGGVLGSAAGPFGTVAGAGLGAGAGKSLENLLEKYFLDEEKTRTQVYGDPALEALLGASGEAGGAMLAKGISKGLQKGGESFYKKAFTPIDQAAELKSKELMPSDIFFREGFTGSGREAGEMAQKIADREMGKVTDILKLADEKAAAQKMYADPQKLYGPLMESAEGLQALPHTTFQDIGKTLREYAEPNIAQMTPRNVSQYASTGEMKEIPGLLPGEVASLKSKLYRQIPSGKWGEFIQSPAGKDALQMEAKGFKQETERLADLLIPELSGEVKRANEVAGTMLTIEQPLLKEAMKQERAPLMTEVTGSLAGGAYANPAVLPFLLGKESVRAAKFMGPRTKAGMGVYKAGKSAEDSMLDPVLKALLIKQMQEE